MKLQSLSVAAFAVSLLLAGSLPAHARPVTAADLSGKIICWSDGHIHRSRLTAGPRALITQTANGRSAPSGVRIDVASGGGANVDMEVQPDGTFTIEAANGGETHKGTGKICQGKPISWADVEGKKTCWEGGDVETDFPGENLSIASRGRGLTILTMKALYQIFEWKYRNRQSIQGNRRATRRRESGIHRVVARCRLRPVARGILQIKEPRQKSY